jgi:hypothetical protein
MLRPVGTTVRVTVTRFTEDKPVYSRKVAEGISVADAMKLAGTLIDVAEASHPRPPMVFRHTGEEM